MGIFDALNTSVAGLQAQSFALQNISGNIANAQTTSYKRIGTSFVDLVPEATTPDRQVAGAVTAYARSTISSQGTVSAAPVATFMAINGDGFFSVQRAAGITDNVPVFSGATNYTRRGDFQVNSNGNLVNGAGYYLMGVAVDPKTGNPLGNVPQVLQFQNSFVPAQATSSIQYAANLPTTPTTPASTTALAGTLLAAGGLNPSDFSANPLAVGTPAPLYGDNTQVGVAALNKASPAVPITTSTVLSGTAPSDSISTSFSPTDTITINGTTFTFVAGVAGAGQISTTDTVGGLFAKINAATGVMPTINAATGAITLHSGTAQDLNITCAGPTGAAAFGALGFTNPVNVVRTGGGTVGTGTVVGNDLAIFQKESISGGAVTAYNSAGTPVNMQMRWAKIDSAALGSPHQDSWNLFYQADPVATGTQVAWVNVGTTFTFGANGSLVSPTGSAVSVPNVSVGGQSLGNLTINVGSGGLTQFASTSGSATINTISQNGYAAGQLQTVAISNSGLVIGTFSNGQNLDLAEVTLSHFNGTNYLKSLDGGAYAVTDQSGPPILGSSGTISGSSLEGSNTDIADEFTKLIVTQQAYAANTKVITTANTMVQDLLSVLR
jgi:flagellar hook protein FlgE